ncbi:MAG: heavy-metal-associated domain-containing protein [Deltaproteobacteria bacterium]|nr:heavy-metal-associated domain-containing protein [Deltaproteobacteria bacterium]
MKRFGTLGAAVMLAAAFPIGRADAEQGAVANLAAVSLHVEGMTCPSCKVAVRVALSRLDGVKDMQIDLANKSASVAYDSTKVTPQQLADALNRLGYPTSPPAKSGPQGGP